MKKIRCTSALFSFTLLVAILGLSTIAWAQAGKGGRGPMGRGPMGRGQAGDPAFAKDRDLFHYLLEHRGDVRRDVKLLDNGVQTLTESDDPKVAAAIQEHVASMEKRVKDNRPIHLRDPLFAAVFGQAAKIKFVYEKTPQGMKVTETSDDAFAAKLIQAHAKVVSLFIENGFDEAHRNHEVPK